MNVGFNLLLSAIFVALIMISFYLLSHLYYGRSVMASLAEFYMGAVDRKKIYAQGESFDNNLCLHAVTNLEPYAIPANITMKVSVSDTFEHGMQVFRINEESERNTVIFYLHGGAYINEPLKYHWKFMNKLAMQTSCEIIFPIYPKIPNFTCEESHEAVLRYYLDLAEREDVEHIVIAGDSSGGGFALALSQTLRDEYPDVLQPEELILYAPWLDVSMETDGIEEIAPVDPMLDKWGAETLGRMWAGDKDVHDPMVSPIYGSMENLGHITMFIGTRDILYPDVVRLSEMLKKQGIDHSLTIGQGLNHPYPLFPIPEARKAIEDSARIINKIN